MSATTAESQALFDRLRRHVSRGRASLAEMTGGHVEVESQGSRIFDGEGREFLDCAGYGVFILGHRHPSVVEAVREQLERHPLATRVLAEPRLADAAETLVSVAPAGLEYAHFVNSGAEATETAIKIARTKGKRHLVSMWGGFHGKTLGALSVTARGLYQEPFRPLLPEVSHVGFGDPVALEQILAGGRDRCVIIEPVQAEGGVVIPPDGYLSEVERMCRRHDAFLIVDEIQTGLARLGTWWGVDRDGVKPDVLLVGKGLSGGVVPVAAAVASPEAYEVLDLDPFLHSSTFAGAPLAMAAAEAAVHTIADDGIPQRSAELGERLLATLETTLRPLDGGPMRDVRGRGLLIGIEFAAECQAADFVLELLVRGVLVNHSLNDQRVVRLTPPALLDEDDTSWLVRAVVEAGESIRKRYVTTTEAR